MINDFYADDSCYAQYQFEEDNLVEDSRRTNTLSNAGVTESISVGGYKEGYCAASFTRSSNQYFQILDSSLCDGFPLKWNDDPTDRYETPNYISFCFWFRPAGTTGTQTFIAKDNETNKRSFKLVTVEGELQLIWGYSGLGVAALTINTGLTLTTDQWYHIGVVINGPDSSAHIRVWNDTTQAIVSNYIAASLDADIATNDSPITIGANYLGNDCLDGIMDELVIFNEERKSNEFDAIRQQVYTGPLQNSFIDDATCKALYRFEASGLLIDSISTNHLTDYNTVRSSSQVGLYMEGKQSAFFDNRYLEYAQILDANLAGGFPLKSTDVTKTFSVCLWFRASSLVGTAYIFSKTSTTSGKKSFALYRIGNSLRMLWGYTNGTLSTETTIGTIQVDRWYHIGISFDGGVKPFLVYRVWDAVARVVLYFSQTHPENPISVGTAPLMLAATDLAGSAGNFFHGYLDEVVIFTSVKTATEIDQIREGAYQRQLLQAFVEATGVSFEYGKRPEHRISAMGLSAVTGKKPQWKVSDCGVMVLVRMRNRTTSNKFFSDPGCVACYSFEPNDPGFLVDHIGGNNLTDHNTIEPVQ